MFENNIDVFDRDYDVAGFDNSVESALLSMKYYNKTTHTLLDGSALFVTIAPIN